MKKILMSRSEIIKQLKDYFSVKELVGSRTYNRYKERSWRFFDTDILHALLIVRSNLDAPVTVNGNGREQRGLRTNIQPLVRKKTNRNKLYISAHILGKAFDFDVKGMTAKQVRNWIVKNSYRFPFKIRLEDGVSWVHLDTIDEPHNPKVYLFQP